MSHEAIRRIAHASQPPRYRRWRPAGRADRGAGRVRCTAAMTRLRLGVVQLGVAAAVVIGGKIAHAQIVNVQGALADAPGSDKGTGRGEGKLEWRTGNKPLFDIGGAGSVVVRRGRVLGLALARGEYGTSRGLTLTKKSFEHVRARIE